jgi:hypothetical protein
MSQLNADSRGAVQEGRAAPNVLTKNKSAQSTTPAPRESGCYHVFAETRLIAVCDTLSKAVSSIPKNSDYAHIFNEEKEEVFFFKKGKLNGEIDNKE